MKAPNPFKVIRDGNEVGEWIVQYQEREVGRIVKNTEFDSGIRILLGYWVHIHADMSHYIHADGRAFFKVPTGGRLAFRNAKEFAFERLAKLLAEGVEL